MWEGMERDDVNVGERLQIWNICSSDSRRQTQLHVWLLGTGRPFPLT